MYSQKRNIFLDQVHRPSQHLPTQQWMLKNSNGKKNRQHGKLKQLHNCKIDKISILLLVFDFNFCV